MSKLALTLFQFGVFICTQLVAQETPQAAADEAKKSTVEGQVLNQVTKEALKRVDVRMLPVDKNGQAFPDSPAAYTAATDAEGKFHFADVERGQYRMSYRKAGFLAGRGGFGATGGMNLVTVKAGETHGGLRYYLSPQGVVTGRVLDDEGEPVQGVRVMLIRPEYGNRTQRMVPRGQATTNDRGEYRITDVASGKYYIQASVTRGFAPTDGTWGPAAPPKPGEARVAYVSTYYPNASDQEQAIRVTVAPGLELPGQDISLRKEKVVKVSGKLVWADGSPVKDASLIYVPRETTYYFGGSAFGTDNKGAFTINELRPGDYVLLANGPPDASGVMQESVLRLHVGNRETENVTLEWQSDLEASGAFAMEESDKKEKDLAGCMFNAMPAEVSIFGGGVARAKSDGRFKIELAPVRLKLGARCPGGSPYVKSILVGDEDVLGKEVDGAAVAASGIKVIVRTDAASVSGTLDIPDEKKGAIGSPLVALISTNARLRQAGLIDHPAIDQSYRFQSKNLRPGEYLAWAFEEGDINSFSDPEFYRLVESKGVKVTLGPNESQTVELKLLSWPAEFADRLQ